MQETMQASKSTRLWPMHRHSMFPPPLALFRFLCHQQWTPPKKIFKLQLLDDDVIVDSQTVAEAIVNHQDEPETPVEVESGSSFMSDEAEEENKNDPLPPNPTRGPW